MAQANRIQVVKPQIVSVPVGRSGGGASKAKELAKRAAARVKSAAYENRHRLTAIGAATGLGVLERLEFSRPIVAKLQIGPVPPAGTLGAAAFVVEKLTGNHYAGHAATGLLSVAGYIIGRGEGGVQGIGARSPDREGHWEIVDA